MRFKSPEEEVAYMRERNRLRRQNKVYIGSYRRSLRDAGYDREDVDLYAYDIDLFLNTYLLHGELTPMREGPALVDAFMSGFFPYDCASTPADARRCMASLKMFYQLMLDKGRIEPADYDLMLQDLTKNGREFIRLCEF